MFNKAGMIALALALGATASPLIEGLGTPVPFKKHNKLTDEDGWFRHDQAIQQVVRDHNKHRRNLINLKRHMGVEALNDGAHITPVANTTDHDSTEEQPLRPRQADSLTDHNDQYWIGTIAIGSNSQNFVIDFDTGSSDLWVPSSNCTTTPCSAKNKYNASASSTSAHKPGTFGIQYGDGSTVSGPVFTDTVTVAGVAVRNQYFSPVTTLSPSFTNELEDGILGMAFPQISNLNSTPFVNTAKQQGAVKAGVFGFKLSQSGSELYLGGTNMNLYTGAIEYHPVVGSGFWQIGNGNVLVGSKVITSGFQTIIDSGTTIIYGPPKQVAALYSNIPGAQLFDKSRGFYSFPCDSTPSNVSFNWGGQNWAISAANFNFGHVSATRCIGSIAGQDLGLGDNVWLLGDSFMKNVYSAFSFDKNSVGFATLK